MMAMIHKVKDAGMPEILTEKAYLRRVNEKRVASLYERRRVPVGAILTSFVISSFKKEKRLVLKRSLPV